MRVMRSTIVPVMLDHAARRGVDVTALTEGTQIPAEARSMETWSIDAPAIPVQAYEAVAARVAEALDDPELALHVATEVPRGTYGVQEFAFRNAPTLGAAAERFVRYERLTNDVVQNYAGRDDAHSWLGYRVPGMPQGLGPNVDPYLAALALSFIRSLAGAELAPLRVELSHPRPAPSREALVAYFGCDDIALGAGRSQLTFLAAEWDLPVANADPALLPVLDAYAEKLMPLENRSSSWLARVRDHLRRQLSGGAPTLAECARALRVSGRTLQRRLGEEASTSYREVVDGLREEEARRLVSGTELSFDEVSFLLGFSERRAFARAFSRWTGTSPSKYRDARAAPKVP